MEGELINETWKQGNIIEVEEEGGSSSHRRNKTRGLSLYGTTDLYTNETAY